MDSNMRLGMDAVRDVIANARLQLATPTLEQLLEAFLYYYDHDAFIKLPE